MESRNTKYFSSSQKTVSTKYFVPPYEEECSTWLPCLYLDFDFCDFLLPCSLLKHSRVVDNKRDPLKKSQS